MPRSTPEPVPSPQNPNLRIPGYRRHRASGQAVVTLSGRDYYLGRYGSAESRREYERRVAEWLARGRLVVAPERGSLTVDALILAFWRYMKANYPARSLKSTVKPTLRRLKRLYGGVRADEFGPLSLKGFRQSLLDERDEAGHRLSRPYVNRSVNMVRRVFRWGVGEELVSASVLHALNAVEGIRYGRSDAPEPEPVRPVSDEDVQAVLPHLPRVVADMVRVQRLTGMRPGEVCAMTTRQLDMSSEVWVYHLRRHKTAHHGKMRSVPIGPRAQEILRGYLRPELDAALFSPIESERQRKEMMRAARRTPLTPSQRRRDEQRAKKPRRKLRQAYDTTNYAQAIRRACLAAVAPVWSPNQLRHTKATELRKEFGLDAAGAVLGHSKLETTQIYAERSLELARVAALKTG
jgi:integrase